MNISDKEEESLLFSLVYCSRSVTVFSHDDLERLVNAAQRHNAQESITGWLVYSTGIFFQWLEGARANVTRLMASISTDPRHDSVLVLSEAEEVRSRLFSGWDMELVAAEDIRAVLSDAIEETNDSMTTGVLQRLLSELDTKAVPTSP